MSLSGCRDPIGTGLFLSLRLLLGFGLLAATLARGLIEQAAYCDWALATGVGVDHLAQWAALELQGMQRVADESEDRVWSQWLIPPGVALDAISGPAIPRNPYDAVRRIGNGLDDVVLNPLRFQGLFAAYEVLGVLTHSNIAGAMLLADQPDLQLPYRLAAIAIHLATAGAIAVALALAGDVARMSDATRRFERVAESASAIHGLPPQLQAMARQPRRPAHANEVEQMSAVATAQQMPPAPTALTELGLGFVAAIKDLAEVVASNPNREAVRGSVIPEQSFGLAMSHLMVVRGALEGTMGKALLPIAARALFEDGARWAWLRHSSVHARRGESLKALVNEAALRRDGVARVLNPTECHGTWLTNSWACREPSRFLNHQRCQFPGCRRCSAAPTRIPQASTPHAPCTAFCRSSCTPRQSRTGTSFETTSPLSQRRSMRSPWNARPKASSGSHQSHP